MTCIVTTAILWMHSTRFTASVLGVRVDSTGSKPFNVYGYYPYTHTFAMQIGYETHTISAEASAKGRRPL